MRAAIFGDEEAGNLPMYVGRRQHGTRLGERLQPRGDIWRVAVHFARSVDHDESRGDADPSDEFGLPAPGMQGVQRRQRGLDRQSGAGCAFAIVLPRDRIAKQRHQPIAELAGDMAAVVGDRLYRGVEIGREQIAPVLGVELRGDRGRADEIAKHHCDMPTLAAIRCDGLRWRRRRRRFRQIEASDCSQQSLAMAERNSKLFKIAIQQLGQNIRIDSVFAKCVLVLAEAERLKPASNVEGGVGRGRVVDDGRWAALRKRVLRCFDAD